MSTTAALLLAASLTSGLVTFSGPPADQGAINFLADGTLFGTVAIDTPGISGGSLRFNMARALDVTATRADYAFGGSFTLTGSFQGGPVETIISSMRGVAGGTINNLGDDHWHLSVSFGPGTIGSDVLAAYGIPPTLGALTADFAGQPGGISQAGATVTARLDFGPAHPAPEPSSVLLVGVGIIMSATYLSRR